MNTRDLYAIQNTHGWLYDREIELLYGLASEVQEGCIVEIGSHHGRSTVTLALGSQRGHGAPVYAIDPHEVFSGMLGGSFSPRDRTHFFETMVRTQCTETVRLINLRSHVVARAWEQPIGLLWIDGDHSYEAVMGDLWDFEPHLLPGARVALHDSLDESLGVARVIREALATNRFEQVAQADVTTVLRKIG